MKELDLWKFIYDKLHAKIEIILMVVADSSKSSPGKRGFKMAVSSDGNLVGTIGGGIMEQKLVEGCKRNFNNNISVNTAKKLYHNKTARGEHSGLICGGTQTVILKTLSTADLKFVSDIIDSYNNLSAGILTIDNYKITFDDTEAKDNEIIFSYSSENEWSYKENSGFPDIIYVIGGGHVGLAVSKLMSMQDFFVVTIDPRKDIITMTNNIYANKKLFIPYEEVGNQIIESDRTYAVVVTFGHATDIIALKSIIHKKIKYIGLMGSKRKISSIYHQLKESGINAELLKKIHTPIGIEIGAESPDEIAVSIAAEIIKVKNSKDSS